MRRNSISIQRRKDMYCIILGDMINSRVMGPQDRDKAGVLARQTFEKINKGFSQRRRPARHWKSQLKILEQMI